MSPPPPIPVRHLIKSRKMMSVATEHPKHPSMNVMLQTKKQARRPSISEKLPYRGWKAVLVIRYEVVSHDAPLAALNSELISAYVDAVMVPSNPERNTLVHNAVEVSLGFDKLESMSTAYLFRSTRTQLAVSNFSLLDVEGLFFHWHNFDCG
jgi:hypothetical protein